MLHDLMLTEMRVGGCRFYRSRGCCFFFSRHRTCRYIHAWTRGIRVQICRSCSEFSRRLLISECFACLYVLRGWNPVPPLWVLL